MYLYFFQMSLKQELAFCIFILDVQQYNTILWWYGTEMLMIQSQGRSTTGYMIFFPHSLIEQCDTFFPAHFASREVNQ